MDTLKAVGAFGVVCIHAKTSLSIGDYIIVVGRIAVPIFFMITGYFYHLSSRNQKKAQMLHISMLYLLTQSMYIFYEVFLVIMIPSRKMKSAFGWKEFFWFLYAGETLPDSPHLWYLLALLYILALAYLLDTKLNIKMKDIICASLILMSICFGIYSKAIFGVVMPELVTRNFLFSGIAYFLIGERIFDNRDKIMKMLNKYNILLKIAVAFLLLGSLFEWKYVSEFMPEAEGAIFITTPALSISIFLCFGFSNMKKNVLSVIGNKYSGTIYTSHLMMYQMLSITSNNIGMVCLFSVVAPLLTFVAALCYAYIWGRVKNVFQPGR